MSAYEVGERVMHRHTHETGRVVRVHESVSGIQPYDVWTDHGILLTTEEMLKLDPGMYGFQWGSVAVTRIAAHHLRGPEDAEHRILGIETDAGVKLEIHVSPAGRSVRVFRVRATVPYYTELKEPR